MKNKGFTLIEILLVVFLIGVLATVAIKSYIDSTSTFKFLSGYGQVVSSLRTARSDALSNTQQNGAPVERYGVCIANDAVVTFADVGQKDLKLDLLQANAADIALLHGCGPLNPGDLSGAQDTLLREKTANIGAQGYAMTVFDHKDSPLLTSMPILIFYESGSGNLTAFNSAGTVIAKDTVPYLNIRFFQNSGSLERYIRVYQVSGLAEESTTK